MIQRYGFIVKAGGYDSRSDSTILDTLGFSTQVVGVGSDEQAILVAKRMIDSGIQVIELCGGFGSESAQHIISSLDSNVPVGYVTFSDEESAKLEQMLASSSGT
ncbi:DUF6506 family protein [Vibrio sp. WZ-1]|uniref:DUF6506 family protein n=1 Tax=Vibrio sp. WZ-1 TaxID=3454501 RepID=UPI003F83AD50